MTAGPIRARLEGISRAGLEDLRTVAKVARVSANDKDWYLVQVLKVAPETISRNVNKSRIA